MFHIPAHKNVTDPPAQWVNKDNEDEEYIYEVRERDPPPYKVDKPTEQPK